MPGTTRLLKQQLKERLIPVIREYGFEQRRRAEERRGHDFPFGYFRRIRDDDYELLEIQLEKGGKPYFVLNFAIIPPGRVDVQLGTFERHVEQDDAEVNVAPTRGRLYPHPRLIYSLGLSWFSVLNVGWPTHIEARVRRAVDAAIRLIPEVDAWFRSGTVGPHLRVHPSGFSRPAIKHH